MLMDMILVLGLAAMFLSPRPRAPTLKAPAPEAPDIRLSGPFRAVESN